MSKTKKCITCGSSGPFYKSGGSYCKVCRLERSRLYLNKVRTDAIEQLGGKCNNCGYDKNIRALQIDHVRGGGTKERSNKKDNYKYYRNILNNINSGDYQVLCANCNMIKG